MIKKLIKLADHLDKIGLTKEASYIDTLMKKYSFAPMAIAAPAALGVLTAEEIAASIGISI